MYRGFPLFFPSVSTLISVICIIICSRKFNLEWIRLKVMFVYLYNVFPRYLLICICIIIYTRNMYWSVGPWSLFIPETCTGQPMDSWHIVDFKVNTQILKQMFVRKLSVIASSLLCRKKGTQKLCSSM